MTSATIKIFLVHGDPKRLRTAEISNWTGKAVASPRSEFDGLLSREEAHYSGVYLLTGHDPESGKPTMYIGEAENIKDRVKSHLDSDYWNQIIFFISKDENLTKAHIRFLEGKLINQAHYANKALVLNGQGSGSKLPESDRADMEIFLTKIFQLLPVLGVDFLVAPYKNAKTNTEKEFLYTEIKGLRAKGRLTPNGFLVSKESQAVLKDRASSKKYPWPSNIRKKLIDEGVLQVKNDHLVFIRDEEFSSPSAAAAAIHGGHANGLIVWKDKQGQSLKDLEGND